MRTRGDMFKHQREVADRLRPGANLAVLLQPGYGKTGAVLTGLADRVSDLTPALVVAPARVAETVWHAEAKQWSHLRHLSVQPLVGSPGLREAQMALGADVEVVSYENLMWLTGTHDIEARYKTIIFDELSKMKAAGTARFRRMRARAMKIPTRVGLTGSPVPNHLLDVWGEMFMVAGPKPLGPTFTGFREKYFAPVDFYQRKWELRHPVMAKEIHERIRPYAYVVPPSAEVAKPDIRENVVKVRMPSDVEKLAAKLTDELVVALADGTEVEALAASTLSMKLRQFASGAVYTGPPGGRKWTPVHSEKLTRLEDLLDELQGEPTLIFYWFQHEKERIEGMLRNRGFRYSTDDLDAWNARKLEVLLLHPQSAGHGLNLQHGGHNVIWYNLPWSHELWCQGNGRLARPGQRSPEVFAHILLCGLADELVYAAVGRKGGVERALIDDLLEGT